MGHTHLHRRNAQPGNPFDAAASAIKNAFGLSNDHTQQAASTVVSVVYVTASKTFDGPIGGYSTQGVAIATTSSSTDPDITSSPPDEGASNTGVIVDTNTTPTPTTLSSTGLPTAISPTQTSVPASASLLAATDTFPTTTSSKTSSTISVASSTSSATSGTSSSGMSAAGKAGLAIGILLLLGAVLSLVLFCFKKRRNAAKERLDDEKHEFGDMNRQASQRTTATAPRLSLRPVTQFLPNLGERRQSRGNALMMAGRPIAEKSERPMTPQSNNRDNPFGNHAETIDATNARGPDVVQGMGPGGEILTGAAAAGAAVGLARGASKRGNGPKPLDFTKPGPFIGPPSPAGTEFSESSESTSAPTQTPSGAAIAAAGGPVHSAVHRVQLDFKPSMDDELELRAGQLIRLLHEYDDGWALCIRLDRSQQGVVPRTCLSTRPVKPRPQQNGPRGPPPPGMRVPQQRPMSPSGGPMIPKGQQPRPMSPAGRPMTPNGHPRPMSPSQQRPMTPNGQRPMTPNGQQRPMTPNGQGRSASPAPMQARRNSPPGPSAMKPGPQFNGAGSPPGPFTGPVGRKPVPGQAM